MIIDDPEIRDILRTIERTEKRLNDAARERDRAVERYTEYRKERDAAWEALLPALEKLDKKLTREQ